MQLGEIAAEGVLRLRTLMVNVYIVRTGSTWVLVDAGLRGYARTIMDAAAEFTGSRTPPEAIVLTHGHFDHIGSLDELLDRWNVPVYAHRLERPYLNGESAYPPPDPLVGGGAMALLSRLYPRGPIDIGRRLQVLPEDGTVPVMAGWRYVFTPGHTAGHISLFRESDRTLICRRRGGDGETGVAVGGHGAASRDARTTGVLHAGLGAPRRHPPVPSRRWSRRCLPPGTAWSLRGAPMRQALHALAANFQRSEVPAYGRYAQQPAVTDEHGIVRLPPDPFPKVAAGLAAAPAFGVSQA